LGSLDHFEHWTALVFFLRCRWLLLYFTIDVVDVRAEGFVLNVASIVGVGIGLVVTFFPADVQLINYVWNF
jgi:hypothetical protein